MKEKKGKENETRVLNKGFQKKRVSIPDIWVQILHFIVYFIICNLIY